METVIKTINSLNAIGFTSFLDFERCSAVIVFPSLLLSWFDSLYCHNLADYCFNLVSLNLRREERSAVHAQTKQSQIFKWAVKHKNII